MKRDINKTRYFIAAAITLCIFLLGIMLGLIIEDKRIRLSQSEGDTQKLDYRSMQIQYEFINQLGIENNCPAILKAYDENLNNLESSRIRLENYLRSSKVNKDDFNRIKRDYTISQIQYWLFAKKKAQICDSDEVSILYFFAEDKSCPDCNEQSFVLNYLKKLFGTNILIFSLNTNFTQEPMVELLQNSYNITQYPTIVFGDEKLEGLHNKDEMLELICPMYPEQIKECRGYYELSEILSEVENKSG